MHQSIKILVGVLIAFSVTSSGPEEDDYGQFLKSYAEYYKVRLLREKFNVAQSFEFDNLKKHGLVKWPCISHKDLSVFDYTIPLDQIEIDTSKATNFDKKFRRKVNKGIWTRDKFAASDLFQLNDTLALMGIEFDEGSYVNVLEKNENEEWVLQCILLQATYD